MQAATYRRRLAIFGLETTRARSPAQPVDPPSCFVVERRPSLKRHCPKLTVFRSAANSSVAFQSRSFGSVGDVPRLDGVDVPVGVAAVGAGQV